MSPSQETSAPRCFQKFDGALRLENHLTLNPAATQADVWESGSYAIKIFPDILDDEVEKVLRNIRHGRIRRIRQGLKTIPKPTFEQIKLRLDKFSNEATAYERITAQNFTQDTRLCFAAYYGTTRVDGMNAVVLEKLPRSNSMTRLIPTARGQSQFKMILDKISKDIHEIAQIWLAEKYVSRLSLVRILHQIGIFHRDCSSDNFQMDGIHDVALFDFGNSFVPLGDEKDPLLLGCDPREADLESVEFSILYLAENAKVLSYWSKLLSADAPNEIGLIVLTGLKNLPDEPFFPALPCILPLLDELPKGLVGCFATKFFNYRVWWIDHNIICSFGPDGLTKTGGPSSVSQGSNNKGSEGNKSNSSSLVFIPPDTCLKEVGSTITNFLSRIDDSNFGAYHVLSIQS